MRRSTGLVSEPTEITENTHIANEGMWNIYTSTESIIRHHMMDICGYAVAAFRLRVPRTFRM